MKSFESVWLRIVAHEDSEFRQVRGKTFKYKMNGNAIVPNTTNYLIAKSQIERAWERMPVRGPGEISDLIAPSYLFAILADERISGE
ncbi:hypothetical protein [Paenibacillus whitsoniae]|uniref:Uncharacterized protein n=1 Tax=Paenibacillus whitsoniae TaxID=2496558 RepID=A0A430JF04_9BACL|nr:hypothetical protein [Paenibacillus whitsoniae]RTE09619.1 hypothetical protein EJQ19_11195 [Paenibacillus whitsoniae]